MPTTCARTGGATAAGESRWPTRTAEACWDAGGDSAAGGTAGQRRGEGRGARTADGAMQGRTCAAGGGPGCAVSAAASWDEPTHAGCGWGLLAPTPPLCQAAGLARWASSAAKACVCSLKTDLLQTPMCDPGPHLSRKPSLMRTRCHTSPSHHKPW